MGGESKVLVLLSILFLGTGYSYASGCSTLFDSVNRPPNLIHLDRLPTNNPVVTDPHDDYVFKPWRIRLSDSDIRTFEAAKEDQELNVFLYIPTIANHAQQVEPSLSRYFSKRGLIWNLYEESGVVQVVDTKANLRNVIGNRQVGRAWLGVVGKPENIQKTVFLKYGWPEINSSKQTAIVRPGWGETYRLGALELFFDVSESVYVDVRIVKYLRVSELTKTQLENLGYSSRGEFLSGLEMSADRGRSRKSNIEQAEITYIEFQRN